MFVTAQGSPLTRFRRSLAVGDGAGAYAVPCELPKIDLAEALALTLLLTGDRELAERLSARWVSRFTAEVRGVRLHHVQLASAALGAVRPGQVAGAQALGDLCAELGPDDLVAVLDDWADRRAVPR